MVNRQTLRVSRIPVLSTSLKVAYPCLLTHFRTTLREVPQTFAVLPITSKTERVYPFEVFLPREETNLPKDSKVKCNQIRTVDKKKLANFVDGW